MQESNQDGQRENVYKNNLNLFTTDFPLRPDAKNSDFSTQKKWEESNVIQKAMNINEGSETYIIHDGPPYANGNIHLGHAYNKILKDIIGRARRMMGYHVPITPGWDCHGLPIEQKVSTENPHIHGAKLKKLCRVYAQNWIEEQKKSFKKLGIFMDWDNPYHTMDATYQADILRSFAGLVERGFIRRMNKTIPWCPGCQTALASAEIEYKERKDPSVYVTFTIAGNTHFLASLNTPVSFLVWTTTPWTLPLNRALLLKSGGRYALVKCEEKYLIMGEKCLQSIQTLSNKQMDVIAYYNAEDFCDVRATHPFNKNLTVPILFDSSVSEEEGTSCVHIAPGCGPIDYELGVKNGLEIYSPVDDFGKYAYGIEPAELKGMPITDGQIWVMRELSSKGMLWFKTSIRHSYPHCWRSGDGLIFRATPQWFFDLTHNELKERALLSISQIQFTPENGRKFLEATVGSRWEWCLSRQRSWGVPIPALLSKNGTDYWIDADFIRSIADEVSTKGTEFWDTVSVDELLHRGLISPELHEYGYNKEDDILDVWFDSGVSHTAVLMHKGQFPADLYIEGLDQHRGWFQSSLLTSIALNSVPPMRRITTHGFTIDEKGHKMSKSLGNVVAPDEIVSQLGTDGLRLWVASIGCDGDAVVSKRVLTNVSEVYRKIRNTCRFLLQNLVDFDPQHNAVGMCSLNPVDEYALKTTFEMYIRCIRAYQEINLTYVFHELAEYCASFLSSFYLDISKDTLYCDEANGPKRRSTQTAFYYILDTINLLISPILSHTSELIAEHYKHEFKGSIHLNQFSRMSYMSHFGAPFCLPDGIMNDAIIRDACMMLDNNPEYKVYKKRWDMFFELRSAALKALECARAAKIICHSAEAHVSITILPEWKSYSLWSFADGELKENSLKDFLSDFFVVSSVNLDENLDEKHTVAPGIRICVQHVDGKKCPRCWNWHTHSHELCKRCENVINKQNNKK